MVYAVVIEDDPDVARLLRSALESADLSVEVIGHGQKAIEHLSVEAPDLVLLDMNLPQSNGVEIVRFINQQSHLQQTHIIVVSGDAEMSNHVEDNVDFVMLKPFSITQLLTIVQRIL